MNTWTNGAIISKHVANCACVVVIVCCRENDDRELTVRSILYKFILFAHARADHYRKTTRGQHGQRDRLHEAEQAPQHHRVPTELRQET